MNSTIDKTPKTELRQESLKSTVSSQIFTKTSSTKRVSISKKLTVIYVESYKSFNKENTTYTDMKKLTWLEKVQLANEFNSAKQNTSSTKTNNRQAHINNNTKCQCIVF